MGENKCNSSEDETLAEIAKIYQCLYNKIFPGYKEGDWCKNPWKAVDEKINLDSQLFVAELLVLRPIRSLLHPFRQRIELNLILAHYRSGTHFKHNILSLRSLTSFQSDKNYRTGVN